MDVNFGEALAGIDEGAENVDIFQRSGLFCVVILRPAFLAGRRTYGLAGSSGAAGRLHRSFAAKPCGSR